MPPSPLLMADDWELKRLALRYAQGADRGDGTLFASVFTPDGTLDGPGFALKGRAEIVPRAAMLKERYASTLHMVMNQLHEIDGDRAVGEVYCIARHLSRPRDGKQRRVDWGIRYEDHCVRLNGEWLIARRILHREWMQAIEVLPET